MSRHHIMSPIVYTPEPVRPKQTRRRRRIGYRQDTGTMDGVEEIEPGAAAPAPRAGLPQHSRPIEAVERRNASTTGNLSEDTLKALLAAQEQSGRRGE